MRTRKLSIQATAHGVDEFCLSVVETVWGARETPVQDLIFNKWVTGEAFQDELAKLTAGLMRHELELWESDTAGR